MKIKMIAVGNDGHENELQTIRFMDKDPIAQVLNDDPDVASLTFNFKDGTKIRYEKAS